MNKRKKVVFEDAGENKQINTKQNLMMEIKEIEIKEEFYPREIINEEKIKEYAENIERLPPITINQNKILLDGFHRLKAHILKKKTEIAVEIEQCDDDNILMRAIELNAKHGLQLSYRDKKRLAIKLFNGSNSKELVNILSISSDCFNKWVRDIRQQKERQFKQNIICEYLKAEQTQQQVADKFATSIRKVSETKDEFYGKINLLIHNKDKSSSEDRLGFEDILSFSPFKCDVWDFTNKYTNHSNYDFTDEDFGIVSSPSVDFKVVPRELIENLLYYYTEPFDVVYFPFAKVLLPEEVCRKWFRRYYINNLNEGEWSGLEERKEWNFKNGLPKDLPTPKLVLVDITNSDTSILKDLLKSLKTKMSTGYIAVLHPKNFDTKVVNDIGFKLKETVVCTYSRDLYSNMQISNAQSEKTMINIYQVLSIFER